MPTIVLQRTLKSIRGVALCCATVPIFALAATGPARADFCIQLNGGPFGGDLGFFRFTGKLPKKPGQIVPLSGRAAGLDPVYGSATVATDGSYVELGATFFVDADQGQIDITFIPVKSKHGSGYGDYGQYGTGQDVDADIVACDLEPERKMQHRVKR
jgi:hypothetical protein